MTTTSYRSRLAVSVRHLFSVEALLCCPVRLGVRGTMKTTFYRIRSAVDVRHLFPSRHYSAVRSRLGARGTITTTYYCVHATVGVRPPFSVEALIYCPVASWCTRNDDNDILQRTRDGGCSYPFFRRGTTLLSGLVLVHAER
ncbi:hypothetical protein TNCV_3438621 [Trichonephila clavipes]|nr:hypothetical protein TNCV_3438621 [Trichonephila clavipes]